MSGAVSIARCSMTDMPQLMDFIDKNWSKGHILSCDQELMKWQHGDPMDDGHLNWICAYKDKKVVGVIGYIPARIFNEITEVGKRVVWIALWKALPEAGAGTGLRLLKAIEQFEPCDAISVLGIHPTVIPIYKALGYKVDSLVHYIGTANLFQEYKVLKLPEAYHLKSLIKGEAILKPYDENKINFDPSWQNAQVKTTTYLRQRYMDHPRYKYDLYSIYKEEKFFGAVVCRVAEAEGRKVLRVIDFVGDSQIFKAMGSALTGLIVQYEAEYVDMWALGLESSLLAECGMLRVDSVSDLIAPNFFEPFLQKNGKIEWAGKGFDSLSYIAMRGDGDQDRPNKKI